MTIRLAIRTHNRFRLAPAVPWTPWQNHKTLERFYMPCKPNKPRSPQVPTIQINGDTAPNHDDTVKSVRHDAKRKNIPPAGIEAQGRLQEAPRLRPEYNPHLPPRLRFSDDPAQADHLPALLQTARERALNADEVQVLAEALRRHEPWLEWSGKRERPWFEVEPLLNWPAHWDTRA